MQVMVKRRNGYVQNVCTEMETEMTKIELLTERNFNEHSLDSYERM